MRPSVLKQFTDAKETCKADVQNALKFKKRIVRLHEEEGCTYKSITAEYGVSKASISKWCREFNEECQAKALEDPNSPNEMELMKENLRLRKELEEAKKENLFLKNSSILSKGNRLEAY